MMNDRIVRLDTKSGQAVEYLLSRVSVNIRRVFVDNSTIAVISGWRAPPRGYVTDAFLRVLRVPPCPPCSWFFCFRQKRYSGPSTYLNRSSASGRRVYPSPGRSGACTLPSGRMS